MMKMMMMMNKENVYNISLEGVIPLCSKIIYLL